MLSFQKYPVVQTIPYFTDGVSEKLSPLPHSQNLVVDEDAQACILEQSRAL